ncbi:MAG: 30S ribosomal protein S7 [Anaerolineae bacterium]|jgi:small subunit ribosomal protein S7|nr:30S ribosomal protein S7 [Anaerolineae bacterium]PKO00984.1 MAG: 30S ribosomal protein S7 [Chloroflexi bacterium HGW-Chloroflexi-5]
MRRTKPEPRVVNPDVRYSSMPVTFFIHRIMKRGKKSVATHIMYDVMDILKEKTGKNPVEVLETALKNVGPQMEVRPRRVGGATYQVPMEVPSSRKMTLAMRWILDSATGRTGNSYAEKLSAEILEAANNTGAAVRKREETHKMAEANRAFSHFRM